MALATALLALAGLFVVSLSHVTRLDLGLGESGLVMFGVSPTLNGYTGEGGDALALRLEDTLRVLPAVREVATTTLPLLTGSDWGQNLTVEGFPTGEGVDARANRASVGPGYFRTLDIPVLAGREFSPADTDGAPRVAIVNQAFARKFQLGTDVVGTRMALGAGGALDIEIVGLVGDSSYSSVRQTPPPQFFLPRLQDDGGGPTLYFYLRAETDAASILGTIRPAVARLDATLPVTNLRTVEEQVRRSTAADRLLATLSATVAGLATLLAGIGLYAVLAQTVAVRWRELGIRMALGATAGDIRRSIGGQLGRIAITGIALGGVVAMALGRLGQSLLVGIDGPQPVALFGAIGIALLVAVLAAVGPTRRASAINPVDALRAD
jgi:predicted permease